MCVVTTVQQGMKGCMSLATQIFGLIFAGIVPC
jgi:hypothetical protein